MPANDRLILVTGATGQQGGAAARHLLAQGWRVRGLTRSAASDKARALQERGAEVAEGDLYDRASVDAALQGAYGVFSVQNFWLPEVGAEGEVRQGNLLADAAQAAGVQHFVYTSVGGAEKNTGIPHFDSKWAIEQHIQALGLPATVLRPVFFMDNLNWSRQGILQGTYNSIGIRPERTMQMIAADDIGALAALAFDRPGEYLGRSLEIAGDELTEAQIAETLTRVIGRPVQVAPPQQWGNRNTEEGQKMVRWFNEVGYQADIHALRQAYPALRTFEQFLRDNGWENAHPQAASAQWGS
jgi:uncharacterized protein YbjT (DUF2867 family)